MRKTKFVRLTSLILTFSTLLVTFAGCGMFYKDTTPKEDPIPYLDNYLINQIKPKESNYYEQYNYIDSKSKAMYMGGYPYHGGFKLYTQDLIEEPNSSYAVFDVSGYQGKTLSFVMGSACHNGHEDNNYYALVSVQLDGTQVVDELISAHSVPKRYTFDLTGKSELKFLIREGCNDVYVAEFTVWDGEPTVTGHIPDTSKNKVQLIKDLLPYLWMFATTDNAIYTEKNVKDDPERYAMAVGTMSNYYADSAFKYEAAKIGGKSYYEVFTSKMSMPISGDDISTYHFNTEKTYKYLSFSLGALHEANSSPGSSWVSVFADGERVFEETVSSDTLPKSYTVDIKNASMIEFEIKYGEGGVHSVAVFDAYLGKTESDVVNSSSTDIDSLPNACKLISSIPPYLVASAYEDPLFDGSTLHKTFSMAGKKYNEGVALYSEASWLLGNRGSHICFNLEGKFKFLTFKAGILDKSTCVVDDKLNIYLDGVLAATFELHAMDIPQKFTVDLNYCKELKIELVGRDAMVRPSYGLAEMAVYKDEIGSANPFPKPENNYPDKMPLIENIRPYMTYVSSAKFADDQINHTHTQVVFDGSTKQEYFEVNGEKMYSGVLLSTSVHLDLVGVGGGVDATDIFATMMAAGIVGSFLGILAADVIYESSFSAFDVEGKFSKVTFTVAPIDNQGYLTGQDNETELLIGSNDELYGTVTVTNDMKPTTYTINIKNPEQLVFYLKCGEGTSPYYAIYDITVEK